MKAPENLVHHLKDHDREHMVHDHGFTLRTDWWDRSLGDVPGGPVTNVDGGDGSGRITRRGLFSLAQDAVDDATGEGALRLLWHSLQWGTGNSNRGNGKRIAAVAADPSRYGLLLRDAALASREDPEKAFVLLRPYRTPAIKHLGPGFFTKFLYFAGAGEPDHPCLIVDSRVLRTLNAVSEERGDGRPFKHLFGYGPRTYREALALMKTLAGEASESVGRPVAGDEVERWAFGR